MTTEQNSIQDRVTAICNDLYAKGTKPSVRMVLSMLPDISSTSTVHKYFASWKKDLETNQQSLYDKLGFSSEFTQSFMKEITRFGVEAEQRYKELSVDANEQRDIAVEDLGRSEEKQYKQNAMLVQSQKEISELQKELFKVQENLKAELAKEQESNRVIVQELRDQLSESKSTGKELTSTNDILRTEIAKAELRLEGNEQFVQEVKEQNKSAMVDNKELNISISELNKTLAGYEATLAGNNQLITNLEANHTELQSSIVRAEDARQALVSEVSSIRKDLNIAKSTESETKDKLNSALVQSTELKASMNELTRVTDKTIASYEATIKGNDKLIGQIEVTLNKSESSNVDLSRELEELKIKK